MLRVQVLLAARGGCRSEVAEQVHAAAEDAARSLGDVARVIVLTEIDDDPFPAANPRCRPFDAVIEVQAQHLVGLGAMVGTFDGLGRRLEDVVHLDLSGALVGHPQEIIRCDPVALRYQYFMRRKAHTTRGAYLDHYFQRHSQFGFRTPNIVGYTQFHVDPELSATAATHIGVGAIVYDSVSELHLESLDAFLDGVGDGSLAAEAVEDEERFVDRENSVSCCAHSRVVVNV